MDLNNTFVVEVCQGCKTHQWNTRHDEAKYNDYFAQMVNAIQAAVPGVTVLKNQVPKDEAMSDIYCQLIPNDNENHPTYDMMPRLGAFEVSFKGVLLYSKILSLMWPHFGAVAEKCQNAHDKLKNGANVADLRTEFQTTGMGQTMMKRSAPKANSSMNKTAQSSTPAPQGGVDLAREEAKAEPTNNATSEPAAATQEPAKAAAAGGDNYPPTGLSEGVQKLPEWIQLGCGDVEYNCPEKGATFLAESMPDTLPDLSGHNNFLTDELKKDSGIYDRLKGKKTALGVNLGHCIKTGIDNKGHPMIKTCGLVAGDEESWTLFSEVMDKVVSDRHGGYAPDAQHPTDMNPDNISTRKIDPTGKYVLTSRCRTGRSVRGFRLPPCNSFQERRDIEDCLVKGLLQLDGELKGDYFPLAGSRSYAPKPNGMSHSEEEALRNAGNLFQEPDSTLLLSSGCGRHWPDARGIFHNEARNFFVWINEEDHSRIISMEKGDNVKAIFNRFAQATSVIQEVLKKEGKDFMHNDHLGWILTCPSNLGTGLRAGAMVKIPELSARADFKDLCAKLSLQARGGAGVDSEATGGQFDISNADRLGKSETTLVNIFIEGVANFIRWEGMLENKQDIEAEIAAAEPGKFVGTD